MALNCGTGSSFLKALVNAFERLHIVLGCEFRVLWLEVQPVGIGKQAPESFQLAFNKR